MLTYELAHRMLRFNDLANPRSKFMDHFYVTTLMGTSLGFFFFPKLRYALVSFVTSATIIAPAIWFIRSNMNIGGADQPNIFYEDTVSPEEVERFQMQDEIERQAHQMQVTPGFGYMPMLDNKGL